MKLYTIASVSLLSMAVGAFATPAPSSTFGPLPGATFGGTGDPTDPVEVTTINSGTGDTITLGLAAQGRYQNPPLANNGAATYYATPGENFGSSGGIPPSSNLGALWNFDYYVNIAGGGNFSDYTFTLYYDFDPAANTPKSELGQIHLNSPFVSSSASTNVQDSENLLFPYLSEPFLGITTPPADTNFNPNVPGEYSFELDAQDQNGNIIGSSDITVDVLAVPDAASTSLLLGLGLTTLAAYRRKSKA